MTNFALSFTHLLPREFLNQSSLFVYKNRRSSKTSIKDLKQKKKERRGKEGRRERKRERPRVGTTERKRANFRNTRRGREREREGGHHSPGVEERVERTVPREQLTTARAPAKGPFPDAFIGVVVLSSVLGTSLGGNNSCVRSRKRPRPPRGREREERDVERAICR